MSCLNTSPFTLAVCAEMIFRDKPVLDRLAIITDLGFEAEIWDWTQHNIKELAASKAIFSSMTGYITGSLADEDGANELLRTAKKSIEIAKEINCPRLNLHGTGLDGNGLPIIKSEVTTSKMWLKAYDTLQRIADLGEEAEVVFMLENLNEAVDHPKTPFAKADDTITLIEAIDRPSLRLNLDLYHAQIGEGNLIELCHRALPYIGEIQVADVPGRQEPGTGEINYPVIARALNDMGYTGTIGFEGWPSAEDELALTRFRDAFTL